MCKRKNKAIIIWKHTRAIKMEFAKKLVELLGIESGNSYARAELLNCHFLWRNDGGVSYGEYAYNPLPDSLYFWEKCNVKIGENV